MRTNKINLAKQKSNLDEQQLVLEDSNRREYFRFSDNRLIEYQLTKANGKTVKLQADEIEGESEFNWFNF